MRDVGGKGEGAGKGVGEGSFPLGSVGSRAGGDNRKRACLTQRRVGLKARPTAGAPASGLPVRASFP